ncbi:hypothetical protein TELCIR_17782, partial [Teladorsagia circumcincta]
LGGCLNEIGDLPAVATYNGAHLITLERSPAFIEVQEREKGWQVSPAEFDSHFFVGIYEYHRNVKELHIKKEFDDLPGLSGLPGIKSWLIMDVDASSVNGQASPGGSVSPFVGASPDYQVPICIRKDDRCVPQQYPPAGNLIVAEAEAGQ